MEKGCPPFLVPWPQIFSDLWAAVVWDSDGEGERGKRTKNVGINFCDGDVGCGLWELYSGMIQGYRESLLEIKGKMKDVLKWKSGGGVSSGDAKGVH